MSKVDKIDINLGKYYTKLGRKDYFNNDGIGKFKLFADESGFDDEGIEDELAQKYDECTILEFDEQFPFDSPIDNDDERTKEIFRIVSEISKYGSPRGVSSIMQLKTNICVDIQPEEIKQFTAKYVSQIKSLDPATNKDSDLKYYFSIGCKQEYPFLMYMVDSFTAAKVSHFIKRKKDTLSVSDWTKKNKFFIALKKQYCHHADQLQSAMQSYNVRVMSRLQFEPTYKINDNLQQITQYILSVATFINSLLDEQKSAANPPFQIDLLIAVKNVQATFDIDDDDNDDDDNDNIIGLNIQKQFNKMKIYYAANINDENDEKKESTQLITRQLGIRYNQFRTVLSGEKSEQKSNVDGKSKFFEGKTYPKGRRFSIFIDRRENKPTGNNGDEITIFEPPNGYNKMPYDSVPEVGFDFVKTCLLPTETHNITANDSLRGQLMSFMFNVEAKDEIRCYILWNSQTMRFHGDYASKILPNLFVETDENKAFVNGKDIKKFEEEFDTTVHDRKFSMFHRALKDFKDLA